MYLGVLDRRAALQYFFLGTGNPVPDPPGPSTKGDQIERTSFIVL